MGLFGSLKKAAESVVKEKLGDMTEEKLRENKKFQSLEKRAAKMDEEVEKSVREQEAARSEKGAQERPAPGSVQSGRADYDSPAQPAPERVFRAYEYGDDASGNDCKYEVTFSISADFIDFDSGAAEVPIAFTYEPGTDPDELMDIDLNKPVICFEDNDPRKNYARQFREKGSIDGAWGVEAVNGKFFVRGFADEGHGKLLYFYGFDRALSWKDSLLYARYPADAAGTKLETMLIAAVDRIAETYCEKQVSSQ
ncbi:MAG: hypothetical protein IJ737_03585 [Ruminococcus sp.]|nr:hypothetical protein [Ruminococcus sp.]